MASAVQNDMTGIVRSYNGSKGYGFINGPQGAFNDVLFSRSELPEDAKEVRGKFLEGRAVVFDAQLKPDGRAKATRVILSADEGAEVPGTIRSYSEKNGYGFATSSCISGDIRFAATDFGDPLPTGVDLKGQLIKLRVQGAPNGKMRASSIQFQTARIAERVKGGQMSTMGPSMPWSGMVGGVVKSFNEKRGYGFVNVPGYPLDIKFGRNNMPAGSDVAMGSVVCFVPCMSPDGRLQANQVIPMSGWGGERGGAHRNVDVESTGKCMSGIVKSYNPSKGWGFISSEGIPAGGAGKVGDVFFMKSNLPAEVQNSHLQNRSVSYELMRAPSGNYRAHNVALA